jgi:predicted transcriptional regulator
VTLAEEDALAQGTRRRIFEFVRAHPGTHMREIQRKLDMSAGTLEYHLHVLVRSDLLATRRQGRYVRYYIASQTGRAEKDVLGFLRQEVPRQVCTLLLMEPNMSHGELLRNFRIAPSTLTFHLRKLLDGAVLDAERVGRETRFRVRDPELVKKCLLDFRASFLDDVVDRFAATFLDIGAGLEPPAARTSEDESGSAENREGGTPPRDAGGV